MSLGVGRCAANNCAGIALARGRSYDLSCNLRRVTLPDNIKDAFHRLTNGQQVFGFELELLASFIAGDTFFKE